MASINCDEGYRSIGPRSRKMLAISNRPIKSSFPDLPPLVYDILFFDFIEKVGVHTIKDWSTCFPYLIEQGLEGLAVRFQRKSNIPAPRDVMDVLRASSFRRVAEMIMMTKESGGALDLLKRGEIEFVVTKGPGIGRLSRSGADRTYSDLDIIVRSEDFVESVKILSRSGFSERQITQPPREMFGRHCREAMNLRNDSGASLDIHHRIPPWLWSTNLTFEQLQKDVQVEDCHEVRLPLVSPINNLLVTALHIVSDHGQPGRTLRSWRDLILLAGICPDSEVRDIALELGLSGWLEWIFRSMPDELQPIELISLLSQDKRLIPHHGRLKLVLSPRAICRPAIEQCLRLPIQKWPMFMIAMLCPRRSFVELRCSGSKYPYLQWWKRMLVGGDRLVLRQASGPPTPPRAFYAVLKRMGIIRLQKSAVSVQSVGESHSTTSERPI